MSNMNVIFPRTAIVWMERWENDSWTDWENLFSVPRPWLLSRQQGCRLAQFRACKRKVVGNSDLIQQIPIDRRRWDSLMDVDSRISVILRYNAINRDIYDWGVQSPKLHSYCNAYYTLCGEGACLIGGLATHMVSNAVFYHTDSMCLYFMEHRRA